MFKVLLRYLILVCLFSAILLHLRTFFEEFWGVKDTKLTGLYMENLKSRKSGKETRFREDPELKETGDNCTMGMTKTDFVMERQSQEILRQRMVSIEDEDWKTANTSYEVIYSNQYFSFDLCLIFAYHVASKKTSAETTFFATVALLFWKGSAFPLDYSYKEKRETKLQSTKNTNKKLHVRTASTKNMFSQGDCPAKWFQYRESKCYRFFPEKMNHESAKQQCSSLESKLVTLRTKEENLFVDQLTNEFQPVGYLWTGVQKLCDNCSGKGSFINWYPGQPDHDGKCVVMVNAGQWMDLDCGYMFAFVCETAVAESPYSRQQLLLALLIPIFSCISVAVIFISSLLVSSIRRGNQPFKISTRYGQTKKQRKIKTWDMIESIRRASLKRRSLRHRTPQGSIPNIEITESDGPAPGSLKETQEKKAKVYKFSIGRKTRWKTKSSNRETFLKAPTESRSSGTCSNSSLYELLVRLNKMDFEPIRDRTSVISGTSETPKSIELQELRKEETERTAEISAGNGELGGADQEQLVEGNELALEEITERKHCFRNMAFRDSVFNFGTNSSGTAEIISSDPEKDAPRKNSAVVLQNTNTNSTGFQSHLPAMTRNARVWKSDNLESSNNTKTVKADVHKISNVKDSAVAHGNNIERIHQKEPNCKRKLIWTYSL